MWMEKAAGRGSLFSLLLVLLQLLVELVSGVIVSRLLLRARFQKASYKAEDLEKIISVLVQKETNIQSLGTVLADLFLAMMFDKTVDTTVKLKAFTYILRTAMPNHSLDALEEGVFANLQKRIRPEKHDQLRDMIKLVFLNASKNANPSNGQTS